MKTTRRTLLCAPVAALPLAAQPSAAARPAPTAARSLDGEWKFTAAGQPARTVTVPHTWQIEDGLTGHMGAAVYSRDFTVPAAWRGRRVFIEFEAVFHTARVSINGKPAGEHTGKGYTAFEFDVTALVKFGAKNAIEVQVDNAFNETMLPRGKSSDWAHDGGIYRPVRLLARPQVWLDGLFVQASHTGAVKVSVDVHGAASDSLTVRILDEATGETVHQQAGLAPFTVAGVKPWHFDHPHLYRCEVAGAQHVISDTFGFRTFAVRGTDFLLNGEKVRLMGVERMAGSHPSYGMAEPSSWIDHDHDDMQRLNCVFTRVHWPQDRRVLDYCDRHGIIIQTEVPAWGPNTFRGMKGEPDAAIMNNGLDQLREMLHRDRNHPSICTWGLCNEVNGQNPVAKEFIKCMYAEAKKLDPTRPCTYAAHSLFKTPANDAAALLDFVSFNQYYGSWQKGGAEDLRATMEQLRQAIPGKPIVISEYGYCACTADRPEGDEKRVEVLRTQDPVLRSFPEVAGLIFFCYNDYRTHVGDKGAGALQQRVHGVVDLYGAQKPSYPLLRDESSPIAAVTLAGGQVHVETRSTVPAHTITGYKLRALIYGRGDIPLEKFEFALPPLKPGGKASIPFTPPAGAKVVIDILRPTGFSALTKGD